MKPQALITGGTRGIGRAICLKLIQEGFDVFFTYKSAKTEALSLETEAHQLGGLARGFSVDMAADSKTFKETLDAILKEAPRIEVLVNNAGISLDGLSLRYSLEDWEETFNTNVKAAFLCAQAVSRPMLKNKKGCIVFISSIVGQTGNEGQVAYSASKGALIAMTKSLAKELASRNIRVNCIAPGFIATKMTEDLPSVTKESILAKVPLGTLGSPEDIAHGVSFLVGPGARYITGHILNVNGGMYM